MKNEQLEVRHDPATGRFLPKGDAGGEPVSDKGRHGGEDPAGSSPPVDNGPPDTGGSGPHSGREGPPGSYPESATRVEDAAGGDEDAQGAIADAVRSSADSVLGLSESAVVTVSPEPGVDGANGISVSAEDPETGWSAEGHYGNENPNVEVLYDSASITEDAARYLGRAVSDAVGVADADVRITDGYQAPGGEAKPSEDRNSYPPNPHMGPYLTVEERADLALAALGAPTRRYRLRAALARLGEPARAGRGTFTRHPRP